MPVLNPMAVLLQEESKKKQKNNQIGTVEPDKISELACFILSICVFAVVEGKVTTCSS